MSYFIYFSLQVQYDKANVVGLDSLQRTGDCWIDNEENSHTPHFQFGLSFLTIFLPSLTIDGQNMSSFLRVKNNSVVFSYTANYDKGCNVTLNDFYVDRLSDIEFGSSRPELDGQDLDPFFATVVVPELNQLLTSSKKIVEQSLQNTCHNVHNVHLQLPEIINSLFKTA